MSKAEHNEDEDILSRIPFEDFFRQHYAFVCQILFRFVGETSRTEDIAQEIFTELWEKRDAIRIRSSARAYLRRMAVSRALNFIRNNKKYNWDELDMAGESSQAGLQEDPEVVSQMETNELRDRINNAIDRLPPKCRIVFLLSRDEELSYAEIGRQLNISIKTVENQIGKALKLLRLALADIGEKRQ